MKYAVGDIIQEEEDTIVLVVGNEELSEDNIKQYRLLVLGDIETNYKHYFGYLNSDSTYVQSIYYVDAHYKKIS